MNVSESTARNIVTIKDSSKACEIQATEEQMIYANILNTGMKIGLVVLILTFLIYIGGIFTPHIPVGEVSKYWGMKSHEYLQATSIEPGWSWLTKYGKGDFLNFFPVAFLAGLTIMCYMAIIPTLLKKKDTIYFVLALIEILVLFGAASGILSSGGH
jgi:hypothetical protein